MKLPPWPLCAVVAVTLGTLAAPAHAWFKVCNKTSQKATVAIAVFAKDPPGVSTGGGRGGSVEGWWPLEPGECAQVSSVNAADNELYLHAHGKGGVWDGRGQLCVRDRRFTQVQLFLVGGETCRGDWRPAGFRRIPAGKTNHIYSLV